MNSENREVMRNILYAVETGRQVYGGKQYDSFTPAYTNSQAEHAITIGAGAWYATEAKRLLRRSETQIRTALTNWTRPGSGRIWIQPYGVHTRRRKTPKKRSALWPLSEAQQGSGARTH